MLSIGLLVPAQHVSGALAAAGVVAGAFSVATGVGGPLLGRLVDSHGQTTILLGGALVAGAPPGVPPALPAVAPLPAFVLLAATIGLATPPVGACMRALLP